MTDAAAADPASPEKASKKPILIGLVAAIAAGGGSFYATFSGLVLAPESAIAAAASSAEMNALPKVTYVEMDPLVISLDPTSHSRHLRFRAQLETPYQYADEVRSALPRVIDILNGYLRALEARDIEDSASLFRIRAQMLRRVQAVTGPGRVNDLLVMEFVLH
ncbi:flagellar basal body-associated FliL family protein [uncultured Tateyamaria sp.]|uniref:flagellar basal body-associated FliL family protein n=1 Tax=uncultured Tateyamaria sp. TaxID=455651 RepID=UPI00262ECD4A|nr:flagellar basal body-associated FliL family protein [uncultured Tateyamaria sp.]